MASAGHNVPPTLAPGARETRDPAQGAEHGLPSTQVTGHGKGAVAVEVPAAVADHFLAAKTRLAGAGAPTNPTPADHKSGLGERPWSASRSRKHPRSQPTNQPTTQPTTH